MKETTLMSEIDDYHDDHASLSGSPYKHGLQKIAAIQGVPSNFVVKVFLLENSRLPLIDNKNNK